MQHNYLYKRNFRKLDPRIAIIVNLCINNNWFSGYKSKFVDPEYTGNCARPNAHASCFGSTFTLRCHLKANYPFPFYWRLKDKPQCIKLFAKVNTYPYLCWLHIKIGYTNDVKVGIFLWVRYLIQLSQAVFISHSHHTEILCSSEFTQKSGRQKFTQRKLKIKAIHPCCQVSTMVVVFT